MFPWENRACAFSTTSTTGSYWLSLRISYANTGIGALAPQLVGPSGQLGKEQTLFRCRGSLFSVWSLDSVNQTARLTQERAQSVLNCLNTFKNRTAAPLKQVSEAPGAYGGCSGGHTAGAAPYETTSTLAPWPSPEVAMAERHAAGPSHSSLPPNLHPLVRPFIPSGRSAPGTGLQARCGLHGCLRQGLGGHVQWACSVGGLDGSPTALAYQLPRVAGSTPGLELSQETLTRRARTGPYGQHCDRCGGHQGGLRSRRMSQLARHLLLWSRKHLRSLRAIHIPGLLNRTADELSRAALPGEWRLHPQTVQLICDVLDSHR